MAVMWKHTVECEVVESSNNHIDIHVKERSSVAWRLTCFYGFSERSRRKDSWGFLRSLVRFNHTLWCIIGDFNDMLHTSDKVEPHPHLRPLLEGFKAAIEDCGLLELDLMEEDFTWEKCKGTVN